MPLPALTLFTKKKTIFTPQNECGLGQMPGERVEKAAPYLSILTEKGKPVCC